MILIAKEVMGSSKYELPYAPINPVIKDNTRNLRQVSNGPSNPPIGFEAVQNSYNDGNTYGNSRRGNNLYLPNNKF